MLLYQNDIMMMRLGHVRRVVFLLFGVTIISILSARFFAGRSLLLTLLKNNDVSTTISSSQYLQKDSSIAYAPGIYMAGQKPKNISVCAWKYGLPA